jgi:hypothetical protein
MANWKKIGTDLGTGAVFGIADQMIKKVDADRAATKGVPQLKWSQRVGTYVNYGVPLLAVGAVVMNKLNGDWATRVLTAGGQLAGREGSHAFISRKGTPVAYNPAKWAPVPDINYRPSPNPQPINVGAIVPVVTPQSDYGVRGEG